MNIKDKFLSLRSKLFALVLFSIAIVAFPTIMLTNLSIHEMSNDFEEKSFENALLLIDDSVSSRYLNLLSSQVLGVLERKMYLQTTAILTQTTWKEISDFPNKEKLNFIDNWVRSLENLNNYTSLVANGKSITTSFLFEILNADPHRKDFKAQSFSEILDPSSIPQGGMYAVFNINSKDMKKIQKKYYGISSLEIALSSAFENSSDLSILVYFLPIDDETLILTSSLLFDIEQSAKENLQTIISSLQERFDTLEFYPKSILALISGEAKLLAGKGGITEQAIKTLPREIFEEARKNKQSAMIFDPNDFNAQTPQSQFFKDFGSSVLRMTYFKALDWYILAAAPISEITAKSRELLYRLSLLAAGSILLSILITVALAYRIAHPLQVLTNKANSFAKQNLASQITVQNYDKLFNSINTMTQDLPIQNKDEVGQLAMAFNQMGIALKNNIQSLIQSKANTERLQGEMNAARDIQMGILPKVIDAPSSKHYLVSAFLEPAKEVGGDLYDFFVCPNGKQAVIIGDVSGKGVAASLFMSMTVTLVRYAISIGLSPNIAMEQVNNTLSKNNSNCMFVTLFIGIFDPDSGDFEFANGGHCYPYVLKDGQLVETIEHTSGPVVGVMDDMPYSLGKTNIGLGESCFLYSDGVSEAMNEENELYGEDRIYNIMKKSYSMQPQEIIDEIYNDLLLHRQNAEPSDDITILCFKRKI